MLTFTPINLQDNITNVLLYYSNLLIIITRKPQKTTSHGIAINNTYSPPGHESIFHTKLDASGKERLGFSWKESEAGDLVP